MRWWMTILSLCLVVALALLLGTRRQQTFADDMWCDGDPVIEVGHEGRVSIAVSVPQIYLAQLEGPGNGQDSRFLRRHGAGCQHLEPVLPGAGRD